MSIKYIAYKLLGGYFMDIGILILAAALVLFAFLAFKQISVLVLAPAVTLLVFALMRMPLLDSLLNSFMPSAAGYISNYFLLFFVGALFGAVYRATGAAESIALWISRISGGKFAAPVIMCITGILTYGGVSGFVVFFVVYPIALSMFKKSNISRRLLPAAISSGCWAWSMTLPGAPSIPNKIAMTSLGTSSLAAFVPSMIAIGAEFILMFIWLEYRGRSLRKNGHGFEDDSLRIPLPEGELKDSESSDLPSPLTAFIPIILIVVLFNIFKMPVEAAVFIGVLAAFILMFRKIKSGRGWIEVFNKGAQDCCPAILNTAIVVGFGGAMQSTQAFKNLIAMLQNLSIPPMLFVFITVAICAAACGSASGGMGVALDALTGIFKGLGINLEYVHRTAAMAAGAFGTMPHQGALITLLGICKLTHKEAYFDVLVTQLVIPVMAFGLFYALAAMGL